MQYVGGNWTTAKSWNIKNLGITYAHDDYGTRYYHDACYVLGYMEIINDTTFTGVVNRSSGSYNPSFFMFIANESDTTVNCFDVGNTVSEYTMLLADETTNDYKSYQLDSQYSSDFAK
jgi:hypothetical protein